MYHVCTVSFRCIFKFASNQLLLYCMCPFISNLNFRIFDTLLLNLYKNGFVARQSSP